MPSIEKGIEKEFKLWSLIQINIEDNGLFFVRQKCINFVMSGFIQYALNELNLTKFEKYL